MESWYYAKSEWLGMRFEGRDGSNIEQGSVEFAVLNADTYELVPGGVAEPALFLKYQGVVNLLCALLPRMKECGSCKLRVP